MDYHRRIYIYICDIVNLNKHAPRSSNRIKENSNPGGGCVYVHTSHELSKAAPKVNTTNKIVLVLNIYMVIPIPSIKFKLIEHY